MGNNLCFQTGERSSQFPQLLLKYEIENCEIALTAGPVENEDVECLVIPTDSGYTNIKQSDRPNFKQINEKCVYVAGSKKRKSQIFAVVMDKNYAVKNDDGEDEKQTIYAVVQEALKLAEQKQMKSVGFPVFESKDHTTSATIMLMAIKLTITEQKIKSLKRIAITLDNKLAVLNGYSSRFSKEVNNQDIQEPTQARQIHKQIRSQLKIQSLRQKVIPRKKPLELAKIHKQQIDLYCLIIIYQIFLQDSDTNSPFLQKQLVLNLSLLVILFLNKIKYRQIYQTIIQNQISIGLLISCISIIELQLAQLLIDEYSYFSQKQIQIRKPTNTSMVLSNNQLFNIL